jgi:ribosomal protein L44E
MAAKVGTVKARDARRISAAEMKYMRITAGYTSDRLQNNCTNSKGVKKTPILDKLLVYKRSWI